MKLLVCEKNEIVSKVLKHAFEKREDELHKEKLILGEEVYNERFSKIYQELMQSLPVGWLEESDYIWCRAGGYNNISLQLKTLKRFPHDDRYNGEYYVKNSYLINRIQTWANAQKLLSEERTKFKYKIRSFVNSFGTHKALFDNMPELVTILGPTWNTRATVATTALVTTGKELVCEIANIRKEEREGCKDGAPI